MVKKYKHILFSFLLIIILLSVSQTALALEVEYPPLRFAGRPDPYTVTSSTNLVQYIQYVFIFLITTAGILGVISIVIAGLQILVTAGSPPAVNDANDRIFSAILGIVLLMTSFIILRTINPQLIKEEIITPLKGGSVWYAHQYGINDPNYNPNTDGWIYLQAPEAETDTQRIPPEYDWLYYWCSDPADYSTKLLVWKYYGKNFRINWTAPGGNAEVVELDCNPESTEPSMTRIFPGEPYSFKRAYRVPGIYFYSKANCQGTSTPVQKISANIPPFDNQQNADQQARSMRIVNGSDPREIYGAILSQNVNLGGKCSVPIYYLEPSLPACANFATDPGGNPLSFIPKYMHIVNFDLNISRRPNDSVTFRSKDFTATIKQKANGAEPFISSPTKPEAPPNGPRDIGNILSIQSHLGPYTPGGPNTPGGYVSGRPTNNNNKHPDRILRPSATGGLGVRFTPNYIDDKEQKYANNTGNANDEGRGSSWFEGSSSSIYGLNFSGGTLSGNGGRFQCNDTERECIRSIDHNGLYYTALYAYNPALDGDKVCKIIGGPITNLKTDISNIIGRDRVIYEIIIIPTTP